MYCSLALAATVAFVPLIHAHGVASPMIVGLDPRDPRHLKARDLLSSLGARFADVNEYAKGPENYLKARQDDRQCGTGVGSCAAGECCSPAGCKSIPPSPRTHFGLQSL